MDLRKKILFVGYRLDIPVQQNWVFTHFFFCYRKQQIKSNDFIKNLMTETFAKKCLGIHTTAMKNKFHTEHLYFMLQASLGQKQ